LCMKTWKVDTSSLYRKLLEGEPLKGTPLIDGVFPEPDYNLADSTFGGLGTSGEWDGFDLKNKKIIWRSFFVRQSNVNKEFIPNKPNEVFFTIVALTDTLETMDDFTLTSVSISSRNHPHYLGQGFIKTKTNKIDFISFITADRNAYAIVNMRLFDLRIGRIILIAPQKDGTLRSRQHEAPIMSSDETDKYIQDLLSSNKEIIDFFTQADNI